MATLYTVGNWTVTADITDTVSTKKSISVSELSYAADYSVASQTTGQTVLLNTTGAGLLPVENLRYGVENVKDVYRTSDIDAANRLAATSGKRALVEVRLSLTATNSVTGEEKIFPARAWMCIEVPMATIANEDLVTFLRNRLISATDTTTGTNGGLLVDILRGDTNPTV